MDHDFILSMTRIHLARLRAHLVILRPILLSTNSVEMARAVLISSAEEVCTSVDVVVNV